MAAPIAILSIGLTSFLLVLANAKAFDTKFSYSGDDGPANWGSLSPDYQLCSNGKQQSPINIVKKDAVLDKTLSSLKLHYESQNATLIDNGFNIALLWEGDGVMQVDGKNYTLRQLHWHSPSEHTIDGVNYPAELHMVHQSDDGNLSVLAVLYKYGDADDFLSTLKDPVDQLTKEVCSGDSQRSVPVENLDSKAIKKASNKYFRYTGSLTVPPCTENVIWNVLVKVREVTQEQVAALQQPLDSSCKNNSRPLQPLNDRKVSMFDEGSS